MSNEQRLPSEIIMMSIEKLTPYERNPRTHDEAQIAQIAASIKEYGFTNPVLIDERGGIIAGHGRVLAAAQLGLEIVPTITLAYLTDEQRKAYVIADNKIALNAGWDMEMLAKEIEELSNENYDVDVMGFSAQEMDEMMASLAPESEIPESANDIPDEPETPITQIGDIWTLGDHTLICGSATDELSYMQIISDGLADMIWTDPPYGVSYVGRTGDHLTIQNDGEDDIEPLLDKAFYYTSLYTKPGSPFYIFGPCKPKVWLVFGAMVEKHFNYREQLVWVKNKHMFCQSDYHFMHEMMMYGYTKGYTGKIGRLGASGWYGTHDQTTVFEYDRPQASEEHPTMKPIELIIKCLENSSCQNKIVLDPFSGSGSTLIACEATGRKCRAIEIEPKYCDVIITRWQKFTGRDAVNTATGSTFAETALNAEISR